jgi:hypothetical protein
MQEQGGSRTLNGRVIFVDEMRLNQLNGKAGLADATTADHHQLIFSRELQRAHRRASAKGNAQREWGRSACAKNGATLIGVGWSVGSGEKTNLGGHRCG